MKAAQDLEITPYNVAVSLVGKDQEYKILTPEEVQAYLNPSGMLVEN